MAQGLGVGRRFETHTRYMEISRITTCDLVSSGLCCRDAAHILEGEGRQMKEGVATQFPFHRSIEKDPY